MPGFNVNSKNFKTLTDVNVAKEHALPLKGESQGTTVSRAQKTHERL